MAWLDHAVAKAPEIFLFLAIPFALPRAFGKIIGDRRQGIAIVITMAIFWVASNLLLAWADAASQRPRPARTKAR